MVKSLMIENVDLTCFRAAARTIDHFPATFSLCGCKFLTIKLDLEMMGAMSKVLVQKLLSQHTSTDTLTRLSALPRPVGIIAF